MREIEPGIVAILIGMINGTLKIVSTRILAAISRLLDHTFRRGSRILDFQVANYSPARYRYKHARLEYSCESGSVVQMRYIVR